MELLDLLVELLLLEVILPRMAAAAAQQLLLLIYLNLVEVAVDRLAQGPLALLMQLWDALLHLVANHVVHIMDTPIVLHVIM
jgi:hypothetical protein